MRTIEYEISTGIKSDFYTLWKTVTIDLRPRHSDGSFKYPEGRVNSVGGNMDYHIYFGFVQNLAKDRLGAIAKAKELGADISEDRFEFDLKHYSKPSHTAFGTTLKHKNKRTREGKYYDMYFAEVTQAFWSAWKQDKDWLKGLGWSVWKSPSGMWYMALKVYDDTI